jgi:hypothetical protein
VLVLIFVFMLMLAIVVVLAVVLSVDLSCRMPFGQADCHMHDVHVACGSFKIGTNKVERN